MILTILNHCKLTGGAVHGNAHVLAGLIAGVLHCVDDALQGILYAVEPGGKAALVAHSS